jgi:arginase family enzyme
MSRTDQVWFQTDDAWDFLGGEIPLAAVDVRAEARGLRFITSSEKVEAFARRHAGHMRPYTLYGSGDFHHLSALWLRQFTEPFILLSFDNHPDWDIRPPRWSCGAWINRALEISPVREVAVWGCGNFECDFPGRLLGNRSAARAGRLLVHSWRREGHAYPGWLHPITTEDWKARFIDWLEKKAGQRIYITIDLDCLAGAITNWENGRFTPDDLVWALGQAREKARVIGGDLCGAWSRPEYETAFQKLAGWFDHPKVLAPMPEQFAQVQGEIFRRLWPALTGTGYPNL